MTNIYKNIFSKYCFAETKVYGIKTANKLNGVSLKPPELGYSKICNKHPDYVIRHTGSQLDLASTQLCLL